MCNLIYRARATRHGTLKPVAQKQPQRPRHAPDRQRGSTALAMTIKALRNKEHLLAKAEDGGKVFGMGTESVGKIVLVLGLLRFSECLLGVNTRCDLTAHGREGRGGFIF